MKKLSKSLFTLTGSTYGLKDLRECLNFCWNDEHRKALTALSGFLAERPNHQMKLSLYRLWVEIARAENDVSSLRSLSEHFLLLALEHKDESEAFSGLKGLCHLAMDEVEACQLYAASLKKSSDPFALEFLQLFDRRLGVNSLPLSRSKICLLDYFHLKTMASDCSEGKESEKSLDLMLAHVDQLYPGSPLRDLIETNRLVLSGQEEAAARVASSLARKFPSNTDYQNLNLIIDSMRFNWREVQSRLAKGDFSFDALALAEYGYKSGLGDISKWDHLLKDLYQKCEVDFVAHQRQDSQRKPWLALVSNQKWNEVSSKLEDGISLDLSHQVYEGDWIFLAREVTSSGDSTCRVFGIFQATWKGGLGLHALGSRMLEPVVVFERSCAVELNATQTDINKEFGLTTMQSLESSDLDLIASAMADQLLYSNELINDLVINLSA